MGKDACRTFYGSKKNRDLADTFLGVFQSTSIEEFLFLGFFTCLLLNWYFLEVDINCCHSRTDKRYLLYVNVSSGGDDTCSTLEI